MLFRSQLKQLLILATLQLFFNAGFAQNEALREYKSSMDDWSYGTVYVDAKTKLQGSLRYNSMENILTLKNKEGTKVFGPQSVQKFYIDSSNGLRYFISSPNKITTEEFPTLYFLEVLKECKHFALLCQETNSAFRGSNGMTAYGAGGYTTVVTKEEALYIFDDKGVITPYMTIFSKNSSSLIFNSKVKRKMVNKNIIKKYIGPKYPQVKTYAQELDLSFRKKNDLVKILEFYRKTEVQDTSKVAGK